MIGDGMDLGRGMEEISIQSLSTGDTRYVGRFCVLLEMAGRSLLLDCGMAPASRGVNRYPDFSKVLKEPDAILISHCHLDHLGGLPLVTEKMGWSSPVYMTPPTRYLGELLLLDFASVNSNQALVTKSEIQQCMQKAHFFAPFGKECLVCPEISVTCYYSGHALGGVLMSIRSIRTGHHVVFTGDFCGEVERHLSPLGGAVDHPSWLQCRHPDVLITECTYGNIVRADSRRLRERKFIHAIVECVRKNGKVLIPVFAFGRFQEIAIMLGRDSKGTLIHCSCLTAFFPSSIHDKNPPGHNWVSRYLYGTPRPCAPP